MTPVNMRMNLEIILSGVVRKLSRIFAHISAKMPTQNQLKKVPIPISFRFRKISRINQMELIIISIEENERLIRERKRRRNNSLKELVESQGSKMSKKFDGKHESV